MSEDIEKYDRRKTDHFLDDIHEEFRKIHSANAMMQSSIQALIVAIKGDELGNDGIIQRHNKLEERFDHYKKNQSNIDKYQDERTQSAINSLDRRITTLETYNASGMNEKKNSWSMVQMIIGWLSFGAVVVSIFLGIFKKG